MSTTEAPQEPEGARLAEQLAKAIGGIGMPEAPARFSVAAEPVPDTGGMAALDAAMEATEGADEWAATWNAAAEGNQYRRALILSAALKAAAPAIVAEQADAVMSDVIGPLMERAEAAEGKLAEIAVRCRQRLDAAIVRGPVSHLCSDILAIIGAEEGKDHG